MNNTPSLAVLGAGPKACAIWAKYKALIDEGIKVAPLSIVEKDFVGANWAGKSGYTDGMQLLVSPSEQDVGFPYSQASFGSPLSQALTERMFQYSWQNFLLSVGGYPEWVSQDRPRAPHFQFRDYLDWVARNSQMQTIKREIKQIKITPDSQWEFADANLFASGLVITGNGKPRRLEGQPNEHPKIFDGETFWPNRHKFADAGFSRIAVIGSGETAASIAANILDHIETRNSSVVELICKQYAYFTRAEVAKDLSYFSNPSTWSSLREGRRFSIMRRADRGVVSAGIKKRLEESLLVEYTTAEAQSMEINTRGEIILTLQYGTQTEKEHYEFVVIATGFDSLWFLDLFDSDAKERLCDCVLQQLSIGDCNELQTLLGAPPTAKLLSEHLQVAKPRRFFERSIERLIDAGLSIKAFSPKLHLPMLAGLKQGPGFPNLNCLGLLSDRILKSYLI